MKTLLMFAVAVALTIAPRMFGQELPELHAHWVPTETLQSYGVPVVPCALQDGSKCDHLQLWINRPTTAPAFKASLQYGVDTVDAQIVTKNPNDGHMTIAGFKVPKGEQVFKARLEELHVTGQPFTEFTFTYVHKELLGQFNIPVSCGYGVESCRLVEVRLSSINDRTAAYRVTVNGESKIIARTNMGLTIGWFAIPENCEVSSIDVRELQAFGRVTEIFPPAR